MTRAPHEVTRLLREWSEGDQAAIDETAEVLKVSPGTVMRDWTFARACLRQQMTAT